MTEKPNWFFYSLPSTFFLILYKYIAHEQISMEGSSTVSPTFIATPPNRCDKAKDTKDKFTHLRLCKALYEENWKNCRFLSASSISSTFSYL